MNMQTIQIMILLLDGFIKLAPWRTVTEATGWRGYNRGKDLARSLRLTITVFAGL